MERKFKVFSAYRVQAENLAKLKTILKPEIYNEVRQFVKHENATTEYKTGHDVLRGQEIDVIPHNIARKITRYERGFNEFMKIVLDLGLIDPEDTDSTWNYELVIKSWYDDDYEFNDLFRERINIHIKSNPRDVMPSIISEIKTYEKLQKLRQ